MGTELDNLSINFLNIDIDNSEDICMICHDPLSSVQVYKLPECGHEYHTHCSVTWFRNGDSRCPYCGNRGINHKELKNKGNRRFCRWSMSLHEDKFNELKKYSKTPNANSVLIKAFKKLDELNKKLKEKQNLFAEFNKTLDNEMVNYKEAEKQRRALRSARWTAEEAVLKQKNYIMDLHIVPLIIPLPIDIN